MTTTADFTTSTGLRDLLHQIENGTASWNGPEANDLMAYSMTKYGTLARKHGLDPSDAAVAAFDVMRTRAARDAADPWAVVTRAVQLTLMYEARAEGLLCSTARARRAEYKEFHDAERFSDRDTPLTEYHPAFHLEPEIDQPEPPIAKDSTNSFEAIDMAVWCFVELGWPADCARLGIEYICARLARVGNRAGTYEALRRDPHPRALLDVDQASWLAMLKGVLGIQDRDREHTSAGRGMLVLFLIGYDIADVMAMPDITGLIERSTITRASDGRHG